MSKTELESRALEQSIAIARAIGLLSLATTITALLAAVVRLGVVS